MNKYVGLATGLAALGYAFKNFENKKEFFSVLAVGALSLPIAASGALGNDKVKANLGSSLMISSIGYLATRGLFKQSIKNSVLVAAFLGVGLLAYENINFNKNNQ